MHSPSFRTRLLSPWTRELTKDSVRREESLATWITITTARRAKLGVVSSVYIPVCLNIISILMFLRFGLILGQVGLLGMLGLWHSPRLRSAPLKMSPRRVGCMVTRYNGRSHVDRVLHQLRHDSLTIRYCIQWRGLKGGAYYLISRSLGPEFGRLDRPPFLPGSGPEHRPQCGRP